MLESARDGLWRLGGAFFHIGLGCMMSHHQSPPHRRVLHIPVQILAGKFKMEFLLTVGLTKAFPVVSLINNWIVKRFKDPGATGVGSKVWVLTLGVLEVNPEVESVWDGL